MSVPTVKDAVTLIKASQAICTKAGLKLHKIISNSRDVLQEFPVEERAKCVKDVNLRVDALPIIQYCHLKVNHMDRGITFNELTQRGYWIIVGTSAVSNFIAKYVSCKRFCDFLQTQKMSDLPKDRLELLPPFCCCAVDFFGDLLLKKKEVK